MFIRTAPIKSLEPAIITSTLDFDLMRCYVCKKLTSGHIRVISRKIGLAICNSCDGVETKQERVREASIKLTLPGKVRRK